MNEILLWRKIARIIMLLAQRLGIDASQALDIFYASRVCTLLHEPESGLQLMSDAYVADEIIMELQYS
jgi:hypothetical protein